MRNSKWESLSWEDKVEHGWREYFRQLLNGDEMGEIGDGEKIRWKRVEREGVMGSLKKMSRKASG